MLVAPRPKRLETTFTSSGWETRSAMALLRPFLLVVVEDLVELFDREVLVEVVVHLHGRSPAARPDALHFFEREDTVGRCALVTDAQLLRAVLQQFLAAAQHAGNVG